MVPRRIGLAAGGAAARIAVLVPTRIPTLRADVDAPAHREMVVEHRDLLMMAAPDGMCAVEPEADRARYLPAQQHRDNAWQHHFLHTPELPPHTVTASGGKNL